MARPISKTYDSMSSEEMLARHQELVDKLNDPAFAQQGPGAKGAAPMHDVTRGTLQDLEQRLDAKNIPYEPSAGRILPPTPAPTPTPTVDTRPVGRPSNINTNASRPAPTTTRTIDNTSSAPTGGSGPRTFESGTTAGTARISVDDNGASRASTNAGRASTGAPSGRSTAALRNSSDNVSGGVAKGMSNSKNLKMLGAASLIGIGGLALRGRQNARDDYERRLQMQREGIITRS